MKDNYLIRLEDLVNNPTPRVPICLCLDTSGSMAAVEGACETTGETIYQDGRTWNVATGGIRRVDELQKAWKNFMKQFGKMKWLFIQLKFVLLHLTVRQLV